MFDTGSSTAWFYQKNNCTICPSRPGYDSQKSTSFKILDYKTPKVINYALGGVEGLLAEDTMCLAPDDQELCVDNLTFYSVYKGV